MERNGMEVLTCHIGEFISQQKLQRLKEVAGAGPVLILTHDNPDPDALASGKALAVLLKKAWNISARLVYSGLVERAENRAILQCLIPEWEYLDGFIPVNDYSAIALVDCQPGSGISNLTEHHLPDIVLDHHFPISEQIDQVAYVDIRTEVGATTTLLYQYLTATKVEIDEQLATAMFYGIYTDTDGLSRGSTILDGITYIRLLERINQHKLMQVKSSKLSRDYFRAFNRGFHGALIIGKVLLADLGNVHRPDLLAEAADLLIRLEDIHGALCIGRFRKTLYFSLRTTLPDYDASVLIQEIIPPPGKAGGHYYAAGGQLPLDEQNEEVLIQQIKRRFLNAFGETGEGEPLLLEKCDRMRVEA